MSWRAPRENENAGFSTAESSPGLGPLDTAFGLLGETELCPMPRVARSAYRGEDAARRRRVAPKQNLKSAKFSKELELFRSEPSQGLSIRNYFRCFLEKRPLRRPVLDRSRRRAMEHDQRWSGAFDGVVDVDAVGAN